MGVDRITGRKSAHWCEVSIQEKDECSRKDIAVEGATCCEGIKQKAEIDYDKAFTPVARMETIWLLIFQAAQFKWSIFKWMSSQHS